MKKFKEKKLRLLIEKGQELFKALFQHYKICLKNQNTNKGISFKMKLLEIKDITLNQTACKIVKLERLIVELEVL
jgi:hypothetical protein